MLVNESLVQKFSFDGIVVDPNANAIYINSIEKRLEPKLIMLLCLFAAQGKQVISRKEITDAIWPNVVIGEESITRAIFALRNALGDDAKQPRYIETIPKRGYRFLVAVQEIQDVSIAPELESIAKTVKSTHIRYLVYVLIALVAIAFFAISQFHKTTTNVQEIESVLPVSKMEGSQRDISLNSDGNRMLFIYDNNVATDIYIHNLDSSTDTLMTNDVWRKSSPQWIDENTFVYVRFYNNEHQIVRQYQQQPPQILYSTNTYIYQIMVDDGNPDILVFAQHKTNNSVELKTINLRTGKKENLHDTIPGLPISITRFVFLPHKDTLLVVGVDESILSIDLLNKTLSVFNDKFSRVRKIAAVDKNTILVAGTIGPTQGIWSVSGNNNPQLILRASGIEDIIDVAFDKKHNAIYYANFRSDRNVNLITTDKTSADKLPELNSSAFDIFPFFSSDEKTIYFISNRTGYYELWSYDRDTKTVKQISKLSAFYIGTFVISNSGQQLAVGYKTDNNYVGIIDIKTGELHQHVKTSSIRFPLSWSNDDKSIYVSEHNDKINLFKFDIETLTESIVAKNAGLYAQESNGQTLMYISYSQNGLIERDLGSQNEKVVVATIPDLSSLFPGGFQVKPDANGFYIECKEGELDQICEYSFDLTRKRISAALNVPTWVKVTGITKDGKSALVNTYETSSGDIMKIQFKN